jgi:hypothetical protein
MYHAIFIGAGATAVLDLWCVVRQWLFGTPFPDYGLVGRWLAGVPRGRFVNDALAQSPPVTGEHAIGWIAHYLTGIAFAAILLALWGFAWVRQPTLIPALTIGILGAAAPLLIQQPGMGAGIASRRTRDPGVARARTLVSHAVFGFGLYAAGWVMSLLAV